MGPNGNFYQPSKLIRFVACGERAREEALGRVLNTLHPRASPREGQVLCHPHSCCASSRTGRTWARGPLIPWVCDFCLPDPVSSGGFAEEDVSCSLR